jgi:nicotinamide-nucleotide amidase
LGEVKLRLTCFGNSKDTLQQEADLLAEKLKAVAGEYIYGYGENTIEIVIGNLLREKKLTLAMAESCTGGYVSHLLTTVPGSSDYFKGSVVAYANEVKLNTLEVSENTLNESGAVSEQVITEMAQQVRIKLNADIGVATSGIAGPAGGTPEKPVGTVWIAYSDKDKTVAKKLQLSKDRMLNIRMSAMAVLNLIRLNLPS